MANYKFWLHDDAVGAYQDLIKMVWACRMSCAWSADTRIKKRGVDPVSKKVARAVLKNDSFALKERHNFLMESHNADVDSQFFGENVLRVLFTLVRFHGWPPLIRRFPMLMRSLQKVHYSHQTHGNAMQMRDEIMDALNYKASVTYKLDFPTADDFA